jgi:hypothetical protein
MLIIFHIILFAFCYAIMQANTIIVSPRNLDETCADCFIIDNFLDALKFIFASEENMTVLLTEEKYDITAELVNTFYR